MLDNNIIEPSESSWCSPIVVIPKPGGAIRLCVDYRKVNAVTKSDSYPIPRIDDYIDRVGNPKYVSKIDLLKGYWQVPLSERAKEISGFTTPSGFYQFRVTPFGMKNSPATFQRLANKVIEGLDFLVAYIDDILVFSNTWDDHCTHLEKIFSRLSLYKLVINLKKTEFAKGNVTYLGHVVGGGQVVPRAAKVKAILELPVPTNKKDILRVLGVCGFYRKFVPNFSDVAAPLTQLLKKNVKFVWSDKCQAAFD